MKQKHMIVSFNDTASEQDEICHCYDWSTAVRICGALNDTLEPGVRNYRNIEIVGYEVVTENVVENNEE